MRQVTFENIDKLSSRVDEAYKTLRTNLLFCGKSTKVVSFTSCLPNEGKTTVVFQLALSMAELGKKTLLIDADIRKSVLASRYQADQKTKGLSEYLSDQAELEECLYHSNVENLDVFFTGKTAPNPSELLSGEKFKQLVQKMRENYDYVLIDCPPLGNVIDAAVVSSVTDGAILILESGSINRKFAAEVKNQLLRSGCKVLGVVLNKVDVRGKGYYGYGYYSKKYKKYYGYGSHYGEYYINDAAPEDSRK